MVKHVPLYNVQFDSLERRRLGQQRGEEGDDKGAHNGNHRIIGIWWFHSFRGNVSRFWISSGCWSNGSPSRRCIDCILITSSSRSSRWHCTRLIGRLGIVVLPLHGRIHHALNLLHCSKGGRIASIIVTIYVVIVPLAATSKDSNVISYKQL